MVRLLILDDEEEQRRTIKARALDARFEEGNIIVANQLEGAEALLDQQFDVAVVDINLGPGLTDAGIGFIRTLHQRQPDCKIIVLTTKNSNTDGVRALAVGAATFVSGLWGISWEKLLKEQLTIYKALAEGQEFNLTA